MIGIAPVVGTPRVVAAGGNILVALVFEIMVAEAGAKQDADAGPVSPGSLQASRRAAWWPAPAADLGAGPHHRLTALAGIRSTPSSASNPLGD